MQASRTSRSSVRRRPRPGAFSARPQNATRNANGKQIISWSAIPEGVTFQPVKGGQRLVPKADGLYLEGAGFSLIVR